MPEAAATLPPAIRRREKSKIGHTVSFSLAMEMTSSRGAVSATLMLNRQGYLHSGGTLAGTKSADPGRVSQLGQHDNHVPRSENRMSQRDSCTLSHQPATTQPSPALLKHGGPGKVMRVPDR